MSNRTLQSAGLRLVWILVAMSGLAACAANVPSDTSRDAIGTAAPREEAVRAAREWLSRQAYSVVRTEIRDLIQFGASAARIKVTAIEGPIWNSSDGRAWEGKSGVSAQVLSRITAEVEMHLRGKPVSSPVTFYTLGDASHRYEAEEGPPPESISGGFTVGDSFVIFLIQRDTPFEDRIVGGWFHAGGYQANWRLNGDRATDPVLKRSMPVAELLARIRE